MEEALEALERERVETEQSLREALARRSLATRGGSRGPSRRGPATPSRLRSGTGSDDGSLKEPLPADTGGVGADASGPLVDAHDEEARAVDALDWQSGQEGGRLVVPDTDAQVDAGAQVVVVSAPDTLAAVFAAQRPSSEYRRNDKYGSFADMVLMKGSSPEAAGKRGGSPSPPPSPSGRRRGNLLEWLAVETSEGDAEDWPASAGAAGPQRSPSPTQRARMGSEVDGRDGEETFAPVPLRLGPVIGVAIASPHSPVSRRGAGGRSGAPAGSVAFSSTRTPSVADDAAVGFSGGSFSGREGLLTGIAALERLEARIVGMEENFASRREAAALTAMSGRGGGGSPEAAATGRASAGGSPSPGAPPAAVTATSSPLSKSGKDSPESKPAPPAATPRGAVPPVQGSGSSAAVPAASSLARSVDATFITLPPELAVASVSEGGSDGDDAEQAGAEMAAEEAALDAAAAAARNGVAAAAPEALASPLPALVGSPLLPPPAAAGAGRGAPSVGKSEALRQRLNAQQRQQQQQQPSPLWARLQRSPLAAGQSRPGARARPLATGPTRAAGAGGSTGLSRGRQLTKGSGAGAPAGGGSERVSLAARSYSCPPILALWRQGEEGEPRSGGPGRSLVTGQKAAGTASGQSFSTLLQQRRLRGGAGAASVPSKQGLPATVGARSRAPKGAVAGAAAAASAGADQAPAVLPLRHTASRSSRPVGTRAAAPGPKEGQARDAGTRINVSRTVLSEFTDLLTSFKTQKSVVRGLLASPAAAPSPARRIGPSAEAVAAAMRGGAAAPAPVPLARKAWGSGVSPVRSPSGVLPRPMPGPVAPAPLGQAGSTPLRGGWRSNNESSPPQPASVPGTALAPSTAQGRALGGILPAHASPQPSRPATRATAGAASRPATRTDAAASRQRTPASPGLHHGGAGSSGVASPAAAKAAATRASRLAVPAQHKGARGHHDHHYASELVLGRATTPGPLAGWGGGMGGLDASASSSAGGEAKAPPRDAGGSLMTAFDISPPSTPPYGGRDGGSGDPGVDVLVNLLASPILLPPAQPQARPSSGGARGKHAPPSQGSRGVPASPLAAAGARAVSGVQTPSRGAFAPSAAVTSSGGGGRGLPPTYAPPPASVPPLALR